MPLWRTGRASSEALPRFKRLVGVPRFERGTSCSQSKRSARLSYTPRCLRCFVPGENVGCHEQAPLPFRHHARRIQCPRLGIVCANLPPTPRPLWLTGAQRSSPGQEHCRPGRLGGHLIAPAARRWASSPSETPHAFRATSVCCPGVAGAMRIAPGVRLNRGAGAG